MPSTSRARRGLAAVGMAAAISAGATSPGLIAAPAVNADPEDEVFGCEALSFGTVCDGPIKPDSTFKRCFTSLPTVAGHYYPPWEMCWTVELAADPDYGINMPRHHIDEG